MFCVYFSSFGFAIYVSLSIFFIQLLCVSLQPRIGLESTPSLTLSLFLWVYMHVFVYVCAFFFGAL